jgi:hypothetical protein
VLSKAFSNSFNVRKLLVAALLIKFKGTKSRSQKQLNKFENNFINQKKFFLPWRGIFLAQKKPSWTLPADLKSSSVYTSRKKAYIFALLMLFSQKIINSS